jgi:toxin ParE1/3/4
MSVVEKSNQARIDLLDIWEQIASDAGRPERADRILDRIGEACEMLGDYPRAGRSRPELGADMRTFPVVSFVIVYRPIRDGIEVVRVLHESRDLPAQF